MSTSRSHRTRAIVGLGFLFHATQAGAQAGSTERAAAEALYQRGTELMADHQVLAACEKFEGSQQLDPALGTMLRLADCYDRAGKTASAWAQFRDAASLASSRNENERQRVASERATDLEKRLSKLELRIDAKNRPAGLEVRLNGSIIPMAMLNTPIPVDPGRQRVELSAPGRVAWSGHVDVATGPVTKTLNLPGLSLKPPDPVPSAATPAAQPEGSGPSTGSNQRTLGLVTGGLALTAVSVGGILAYRAYNLNQQSLSECRVADANACTPTGKDRRDEAKQFATASTVALAVGGSLAIGTLVLLVTARPGEPRPPTTAALNVFVSPSGGSIRWEGAF